MKKDTKKKIDNLSLNIRKNILDMAYLAGASSSHLGGALFGFLAMQNLNTDKNILSKIDKLLISSRNFLRKKRKRSSGERKVKTDEENNNEKKNKQDKTERIIQKNTKKG